MSTADALAIDLPASEAAQVKQAGNPETAPDVLRALAAVESVTVRAALAMNAATPPEVDVLLATDRHEVVRVLLARKLAMLVPCLPQAYNERLQMQAYRILAGLVADEATRVRAMIGEILREMPQAPHELIVQLAHDREFAIAEPVIRLSPLLTAADLLALLDRAESPGTAVAVARRDGLDAAVSEAIARSENTPAIAALLANHSAAIREATLDALVERAGPHLDWHRPLVQRPGLSGRAARALSEIVATQLLGELAERGDLDPQCRAELRRRLTQRLASPASQPAPELSAPELSAPEPSATEAMLAAGGLDDAGKTDEAALLAAVGRGDGALSGAILAKRAGLPASMIERAASLRSAKGLVSLTWAAGFSMRVAEAVQLLLGRLTPAALLHADAVGGFPLGVDEMRWQIELLKHTEARKP